MTGEIIGILGGSFNPPHIAHVLACQFALCRWRLNRVMVVPSFIHPFEKDLESYHHRFEMTKLAFITLEPSVEISRMEEEMGAVSFTIDTIRELRRRLPGSEFRLIVGSDIVPEMEKWKETESIRLEAPPLIVPRLDASVNAKEGGEFFLPDVSSTSIRDSLKNGADPGPAVPWRVMEYIRAHNLYGALGS